MPRKLSVKAFIENRLRWIASSKKTPPTTMIRALDRLALLENIYVVQVKDQEPNGGSGAEPVETGVDSQTEEILKAALNIGRRNGNTTGKQSGS